MSAWEFFSRLLSGSGFGNISPARLKNRLSNVAQDILLVDLRESDRFKKEHIARAISSPFDDFLKEVVVYEKYEKDQEMILICDTGHMSRVAADILNQDEGFEKVVNLSGGMKAWEKSLQAPRTMRCCRISMCC